MFKLFSYCLLGSCILFSASFILAAEWETVMEKSGIRVQQQNIPSGHSITRASKEIKARLPVLITILRDPKICKDLIHLCRDGWMVSQYDNANRLDYVVIDAPLLFQDRDLYVHSHSSWDAGTRTVMIKLAGRENHDSGQPERVRIRDFQGFWRLQAVAEDKVAVTYQAHYDPQIPGTSFMGPAFADSAFHTLFNLEKLSKQAKYQTDISINAMAKRLGF